MKFLIAGAGAIGGYIGAKLAKAGEDVTLFARGPHLEAMRARGLRVISSQEGGEEFEVHPGVIRHNEGNRISLGEPDGSRSDRVRAIAERLIKAGLKAPVTARLRHEIWVKILGNVAFNPISALTRATLEQIVRDGAACALV